MGTATGVLRIAHPDGTKRFEWNGQVEDKDAARSAFEGHMTGGYYVASASTIDAPSKREQIGTFDEALKVEQERGTVEVLLTPAIAGG